MTSSTKRGWRRRKVWVPLALIIVVVVTGVALRFVSKAGAARQLAEIRKQGLPASALELDTWYKRVPREENAAMAILDATLWMRTPGKSLDESSTGEFETSGPLPEKLAEAIASYASSNQPAIEKIEAAVQLKGSRYSVDLSKGAWTLLPHLSGIKQTATMMKWAAVQSSIEGKREEAVRRFKAGMGVANSLAPEPLLISEYVRVACVSILLPALERIANDHSLTAEEARELAELLERTEELGRESLFRAMVGERAIGVEYFDLSFQQTEQIGISVNSGSGNPWEDWPRVPIFYFRRISGMKEQDRSFYLDVMEQWVEATRLDFPEMLRVSERVDKELHAEVGKRRLRYLVSGQTLSALGGSAKKEALLAARLRCARMGMAIEEFRARNGGKVPNLAELEGEYLKEILRDPTDGAPLEFRLNSGGGYQILAATATEILNEGRRRTNAFAAGFVVRR